MPILRMALVAMLLILPLRHVGAAGLLPELDTSNPVATYHTFLSEALRLQHLYRAYRDDPTIAGEVELGFAMKRVAEGLFDLSQYPPATRLKDGTFSIGYLADILHRLPVPAADAAAHIGAAARWSVPGTQIRLERVAQGPRTGEWLFSADTLARLPEFHAQILGQPVLAPGVNGEWHGEQMRATGPWLAGLRVDTLPHWLQRQVLGMLVWKSIAMLLVILLVAAIVLGWRRVVARRAPRLSPLRRRLLWLSVPLLMAVLTMVAHALIVSQIVPSGRLGDAEALLAIGLLYVAAAWAAWVLCWLVVEAAIASPALPDDSFDANLLRMLARVCAPLAAASVLIMGASDVGVPAVGLLAGVSIGGIALALAAQSTVENLFGGLSIFADRPFRVGDEIRFGEAAGKVEAIGPRSTRIRGADGTLTTVPNSDLAKMQVTNITTRTRDLFRHRFALPAATPRARLAALLATLRERVAAHPHVERTADMPRARLVGYTGDTVQIEVQAQVLARTAAEFLEVQEALILVLMHAVEDTTAERARADATEPVA
jgi:MscS family membrane protein